MQRKIIISLAALIVAFIFCGALSAASVQTNHINMVKITNVGTPNYDQVEPAISGTRIVWRQIQSGKSVVYVKNLATNMWGKLFSSTNQQYTPTISGTRIAWEEYYYDYGYLYLKNLVTQKIGIIKSGAYNYLGSPAIDGNILVFESVYTSSGGYDITSNLIVKNLLTGSNHFIKAFRGNQFGPDISGTRVVWEECNQYQTYGPFTIYVKNLATGGSGKVLPSTLNQENPKISGSRIVWEQKLSSGYTAIYVKNLATNQYGKVFSSNKNQSHPDISGSRIVWEQKDSIGHNAIYMKDLTTKKIGKILNTVKNQHEATIDGNRVVWTQDTTNGHKAIYVKNLATNKSSKLTP